MINYALILTRRYPDAKWSLRGTDYRGLDWHDDSVKPTKETLDALWPEVQLEVEADRVRQERRQAYLNDSDPYAIKALYAGTQAERDALIAEGKARRTAIQERLPYPEGYEDPIVNEGDSK